MNERIERPKAFAFIPVNGLGKPQKCKDKRLIRRHVMHGRNLRIGVRPVPSLNGHLAPSDGHISKPISEHKRQSASRQTNSGSTSDETPSLAVRSCVSPFRFYHNLDACSQGLTFDFYTGSSTAICNLGMDVDFDLGERLWHQWVVQDATYTHPLLFCISASYCVLLRAPLGKTALYHLDNTIRSLNQRLADPLLSMHDSTTCMVATLVLAFSSLGEHTTARIHMKGLAQIMRLRGGLARFKHCAHLLTKVARYDLAAAIHSGEEPVFLQDQLAYQDGSLEQYSHGHNISMTSELYIGPSATLGNNIPADTVISHLGPQIGVELQVVSLLRRVQSLTHQLNTDPSGTLKQLSTIESQNLVHLLQYQLLALRNSFAANDVTQGHKAFCLTLLAFLVSASEVSSQTGREASAENSYLKDSLRASCNAIVLPQLSGQHIPRDILLWILLVGAVTVFKIDTAAISWSGAPSDDLTWLRARWNAEIQGSAMTWEQVRGQMKGIVWIDAIHDKPGRRAFEALSRAV
ncbi:hypothetical protein V8F33_010251 [Rhypophila sp. PSN 637]